MCQKKVRNVKDLTFIERFLLTNGIQQNVKNIRLNRYIIIYNSLNFFYRLVIQMLVNKETHEWENGRICSEKNLALRCIFFSFVSLFVKRGAERQQRWQQQQQQQQQRNITTTKNWVKMNRIKRCPDWQSSFAVDLVGRWTDGRCNSWNRCVVAPISVSVPTPSALIGWINVALLITKYPKLLRH